MRRRNLSEELDIKLNDDIVLDDGSEKKEEAEKAKEEYFDEVQKDLDQKLKVAEEIRDAEAPKVEANDGKGKALKIKQFTEKLSLSEENSRFLTEEFDEDRLFNMRSSIVHDLYEVLAKYASWLYYDSEIEDEEFSISDELESVCEEALFRTEDGEWA